MPKELYVIETLTKLRYRSAAATMPRLGLIRTTTLSFNQVYLKHEQPQIRSPDSHVTIGTIHRT